MKMFTEDDSDRMAEIERDEITRWKGELAGLVGRPVEVRVDWESTYTLAPSLEPDFKAAGDLMIESFRLACEDEETRSRLAADLARVTFTSVSPHIGFGCLAEGAELQFRASAYPHASEHLPPAADYGKWLGDAARDLG
jgi:hypothetical protein